MNLNNKQHGDLADAIFVLLREQPSSENTVCGRPTMSQSTTIEGEFDLIDLARRLGKMTFEFSEN